VTGCLGGRTSTACRSRTAQPPTGRFRQRRPSSRCTCRSFRRSHHHRTCVPHKKARSTDHCRHTQSLGHSRRSCHHSHRPRRCDRCNPAGSSRSDGPGYTAGWGLGRRRSCHRSHHPRIPRASNLQCNCPRYTDRPRCKFGCPHTSHTPHRTHHCHTDGRHNWQYTGWSGGWAPRRSPRRKPAHQAGGSRPQKRRVAGSRADPNKPSHAYQWWGYRKAGGPRSRATRRTCSPSSRQQPRSGARPKGRAAA